MTDLPPGDALGFPLTPRLLRWIYLARVVLVSALLTGALVVWRTPSPDLWVALSLFVVGVAATGASFWWTHVAGREPRTNFRYLQVLLDVALVTGTVHITGGSSSEFSPLYILVISEGALLLPLSGGVLMGIMASVLFFAESAWFQGRTLDMELALQMGLFTGVALATGLLGDRLRRAGTRLGAVESELRQLRLDTSEILDSLSTGVLTVDGAGRVAYLNHSGGRLLALDPAAQLGRPVQEVLREVAPAVGRLLIRSLQDRVPVLRFKTTIDREGRPVVLGVSTTVMERGQGGEPSATAIFQDITIQDRAEILDRRNQRLEAVAELSASLAHEIKNPLASIRSSVEQLTGAGLDDGDRDVLGRLVLTESDRLSRLLSEFLEFSALRKGASELVDLPALVGDAVRLAQQHPDAPEGVTVTCLGMDQPLHIPGDADLLHRAVYNLVLNALQFAGEEGAVAVSLTDHRGGAPPEPVPVSHPVRVAVADTGPGISREDAARIFDPFYTTRQGGNGLGLAVVHRAVEAHQGAVLAGPGPMGGAEFVMILPGVEEEDE
ncbi:MAG TPA: ATP-binding protein [Longimicrobiales bacterium]|nr:ATP-binding protein [Longimicrobiales bacterium]